MQPKRLFGNLNGAFLISCPTPEVTPQVQLPSSVHCKSTVGGERSSCDAEAEREIWPWLWQQLTQFFAPDLQKLVKHLNKCNNVGCCMEQCIVCSGNFLVYFIASVGSFLLVEPRISALIFRQ